MSSLALARKLILKYPDYLLTGTSQAHVTPAQCLAAKSTPRLPILFLGVILAGF